jgi:hypothetical protein
MWKSAKANVDDLMAKESDQLRQQKIHKICTAMEVLVLGADEVSTTKCRQFQVRQNYAQEEATTWLDSDYQK